MNMDALDFLNAGKHLKHAGTKHMRIKLGEVEGEFKRMHGKKST